MALVLVVAVAVGTYRTTEAVAVEGMPGGGRETAEAEGCTITTSRCRR